MQIIAILLWQVGGNSKCDSETENTSATERWLLIPFFCVKSKYGQNRVVTFAFWCEVYRTHCTSGDCFSHRFGSSGRQQFSAETHMDRIITSCRNEMRRRLGRALLETKRASVRAATPCQRPCSLRLRVPIRQSLTAELGRTHVVAPGGSVGN